jgi:hypothetical protein
MAFVVVAVVLAAVPAMLVLITGRPFTVVAAGLGLAVAYPILVWLASPEERPADSRCADCGSFAGKYWEPQTVIFVVIAGLICWTVGSLLGAGIRAVRRSSVTA